MSRKARRRPPAAHRRPSAAHRGAHGCSERLAIASVRVLDGREPLRLVMRYPDGGWAFLCNTTADVENLVTVHEHHLFDEFPLDLLPLRVLPPGHVAVRDAPGHAWSIEPYVEE